MLQAGTAMLARMEQVAICGSDFPDTVESVPSILYWPVARDTRASASVEE